MTARTLPQSVLDNIACLGEGAHAWARLFGTQLDAITRRWQLELGEPYPGLSFHYVVPAQRGDERLVLKLGVSNVELTSEIEALAAFEGRGMVR